jgi:predicted nucleic acid-binding protein
MDHLIFVDTNILLDFYRSRNEASLRLLNHIDTLHDKLITTYQVEEKA